MSHHRESALQRVNVQQDALYSDHIMARSMWIRSSNAQNRTGWSSSNAQNRTGGGWMNGQVKRSGQKVTKGRKGRNATRGKEMVGRAGGARSEGEECPSHAARRGTYCCAIKYTVHGNMWRLHERGNISSSLKGNDSNLCLKTTREPTSSNETSRLLARALDALAAHFFVQNWES